MVLIASERESREHDARLEAGWEKNEGEEGEMRVLTARIWSRALIEQWGPKQEKTFQNKSVYPYKSYISHYSYHS
jgi:hypothetical protein